MEPAKTEVAGRILVVDDQRNMRATTAMLLRASGYQVHEAEGGEQALGMLGERSADLMLTDLKMEPMDGLTLLKRATELSPRTQVILMTAYGSIESAVEAMRTGAYDYITKPFKEGELLHRVQKALERARLLSQVELFAGEFHSRNGLSALVGRSAPMGELTARISRVAPSDATVLIQGESGTGKELVARAVHALSRRRDKPFVPVNCAAITESLLESELFGHAKGAFTGAIKARRGLFEEADGGTLFIDEVTETTPGFQTKLLRALQDGEVRRVGESTTMRVDVRVIAASNRDVERQVVEGRFRQDLFYRLNVVGLRVPSLRERLEDVPLLAEHFLKLVNLRNPQKRRLSPQSLEHLQAYEYPGNVRELENLVEQAAALADREELTPADFPLKRQSIPAGGRPLGNGELKPEDMVVVKLSDAVDEAERRAIRAALARSEDLTHVARDLGVSSTTLWRKMKKLGLRPPSGAPDLTDDNALE
jgi:two-component system response regulator HydG